MQNNLSENNINSHTNKSANAIRYIGVLLCIIGIFVGFYTINPIGILSSIIIWCSSVIVLILGLGIGEIINLLYDIKCSIKS